MKTTMMRLKSLRRSIRRVGCNLGPAWIASISLAADEPYVNWIKSPRGSSVGTFHFLTSDAAGGVIAWDWEGGLVHLNAQGGTISSNLPVGSAVVVTDVDRAGNQYWTGRVYDNVTFSFPQVRGGFVAKVGPAGQFAWIRTNEELELSDGDYRQWTYTTYDGVKADKTGSVVVAGTSKGPFKLQSLEWDGEKGPFVVKLDAGGKVLWGHKMACQANDPNLSSSYGVPTLDPAGKSFVSGWLSAGSAEFGDITVYPAEHYPRGDYFVAKYTPEGQLLWVKLGYGVSLAVGRQSEVYTVFTRFDSDPREVGLARLSSDGAVLWEKPLQLNGWEFQVALDPLGQPIIAGGFSGTLRLDDMTLRSRTADFNDFFVAKMDTNGHTLWAITGGGARGDSVQDLVCDAEGAIFIGGDYDTSATFDGWSIRATFPTTYGIPFIAKISEEPPLALNHTDHGIQLAWPAKATNWVLEATSALGTPAWAPGNLSSTVSGRDRTATVDTAAMTSRFYRLRKP